MIFILYEIWDIEGIMDIKNQKKKNKKKIDKYVGRRITAYDEKNAK